MAVPFEWRFINYNSGPYSFDLAYLIGEINGYRLIELVPQWEFRTKIKVTGDDKEFYEDVNELCYKCGKQIEFVTNEAGSKNLGELERLATGLYVTLDKKVENKTVEKGSQRLSQLKPHIELGDARVVMSEVGSIIERARAARNEM